MRSNRSMLMVAIALVGLGFSPTTVAAQGPAAERPVRVEMGAGLSYFPSYVLDDAETRQWGVALVARLGRTAGRHLELAYTHVPQRTTTSSAAPRLHAVRAMLAASAAIPPGARVRLTGALGVAALKVDAQPIDCGGFPLCDEWAPRDGTRVAPVAGVGTTVHMGRRLRVFGEGRAYRPMGDAWSAAGDPAWLTEVSLGIGLRL